MKKHIYLLITLLFSLEGFSQIEPMYAIYRNNPLVVSPAFAGKDTVSSLTLMSRLQWIGVAGAPKTIGLTGSFATKNKSGFGIICLQDKAGPMKNTSLGVDYAYHTNLTKNLRFSGGIRVSINDLSVNLNSLKLIDMDDVNFGQNISTGFTPNLGWGLSLSNKNTFISISEPRIFRHNFRNYNIDGNYKDYAHYYIMAGTSFAISESVQLKPTAMLRVVQNSPISADVNLTAGFQQKLDLGLTYRLGDSFGVQMGYLFSKKYYIGYIYELPISEMRAATVQTHEFALKYMFSRKNKEY